MRETLSEKEKMVAAKDVTWWADYLPLMHKTLSLIPNMAVKQAW